MSDDLSGASFKLSNRGFNPITKQEENVTEWLKDPNNIVFSVQGIQTPLCFSRASFDSNILQLNHILYKCDKKDGRYAKKIIKNSADTFLDLGMFNMIDGTATNLDKFSNVLNRGQTFSVKKNPEISLSLFNDEMRLKMNDFNATFLKYSGDFLYPKITDYFLTGTDTTEDVMKHIAIIDQFFMEHATRTSDKKTKFYRGMKVPYPIADGESMIVHNYISTTTTLDPVGEEINLYGTVGFGGVPGWTDDFYYDDDEIIKPPHLPDDIYGCCAYELTLDKDIPYVDMKYSTIAEQENEVLLPRNLLITLTGEYISKSNIHVRQLRVSKTTENQFDTIPQSRCAKFIDAVVDVAKIEFVDSEDARKNDTQEKVAQKKKTLTKEGLSKNQERCKKGTTRNKRTGNCDPTRTKNNRTRANGEYTENERHKEIERQENEPHKENELVINSIKNVRCKKGTMRNKKTGNCDPTKTKKSPSK